MFVAQIKRQFPDLVVVVAGNRDAETSLAGLISAGLVYRFMTEPAGDNALELYSQAQAQNPDEPKARAGLAEVHERLLARAENALLEERLDEASMAIETATQGFDDAQVVEPEGGSKSAEGLGNWISQSPTAVR